MAKANLHSVPTANNEQDIEALALKAKLKRQADCVAAVNKVLAEHNCDLVVFVQIGDELRPLGSVLGLPMRVDAVAKEVQPNASK